MKHFLLTLFTLHFALFTLSASAAVPLKWTVETSRAVPAQFEAYQGETLALEAALQSYGKPLEAPSNYSLYWQTNGMGSTYWSVPVRVPSSSTGTGTSHSNLMYATWSPTNDVGARVYNCFIGQPGTIYHAAFQLRLRPSPGALPNELPLPQKVIDFAKVTVLNPPWSGGGGGVVDTNAVRDIVTPMIGAATNGIPEHIAALQDGKRDKTDLGIYEISYTSWSFSGDDYDDAKEYYVDEAPQSEAESDYLLYENGVNVAVVRGPMNLLVVDFSRGVLPELSKGITAKRERVLRPTESKISHTSATSGLAKFGTGGSLVAAKKSSVDGETADYRDPQDNTCHKTEFGDFVNPGIVTGIDPGGGIHEFIFSGQPEYMNFGSVDNSYWEWTAVNGTSFKSQGGYAENAQSVPLYDVSTSANFTATRSAVCTSGEKFTTSDVVDGKVSSAVSTNNPAFVSAVRNTPAPEPGQGEDPPWGTWGTLGAAIAGLVSGLAWVKNKIGVIFDNEGEIQDDFATDLLGKQVAKAAIVKECLYDEYTVPTTGDDAYDLHANASNLLVFNSSQTSYTFDLSAHLPQKVNGKLMDFFIELNTDAPVTVSTNAADTAKIRGDSPSVSEAGNYWITFSTKADGTIYIRNINMEAPQS